MASRAEKRRAERREQREEQSSSKAMTWALAAAGGLAVAIVGWNVVSSLFDGTVRSSAEIEFEFSTPQELIAAAVPVSLGNPDAPVTVMEFGDYQCPACQNFYRQAKPILDVSYIEPGRVRFEFYDFPLEATHPNAFLAARAARCAGDQDRYWDYHDRLFQNQILWSVEPDPAGAFTGYADDLGLDGGEFRSCLRSDRHAEVVVANQMLGIQLGAQSTPTVMLNAGDGRATWIDNWTTNLRPVLEAALAEATGDAAPAETGGG